MILVDLTTSDIVSGYNYILSAEERIKSKWRNPLLAAYAKQRKTFEDELAEYEKERFVFIRRIRLGIWLASVLLVLGVLVLPGLILIVELGDIRGAFLCFAPILILGGLTGWAIIIILWISQRVQEKPVAPINPLRSGVICPLLPLWKEGLRGKLPSKKTHPDATGEFHFIARLQVLDEGFFILYGINRTKGENVDLILVGPKGIWVFEVEHLEGLVRWQDGNWTQELPRRLIASRAASQAGDIDQAIEDNWQRAADYVTEAINRHAPTLASRYPNLTQVRGGIVFTHPKGRYAIPPGCPFNWGVVPFWLEKLSSVPVVTGIDDYTIMKIIEAILLQHREISGETRLRSMETYAHQIRLNADDHLREWVELH
jgi:hypothetical protein